MYRSAFPWKCLLLGVFLLASVASKAALTTYSTQLEFEAALNTPDLSPNYLTYLDDFETFPPGELESEPLVFTSFVDLTGGGDTLGATFDFRISAVGGGNLFVVSAVSRAMSTTLHPDGGGMLLLTFTSGNVTAVGANFFLTDESDESEVPGNLTVSLNGGTPVPLTSGSTPFLGFTTDSGTPITSLLIAGDAGDFDFVTMDNLQVGEVTPVPEPAQSGVIAVLFLVACSVTHSFYRRRTAA